MKEEKEEEGHVNDLYTVQWPIWVIDVAICEVMIWLVIAVN